MYLSRRRVLAGLSVGLVGVGAGCADDGGDADGTDDRDGSEDESPPPARYGSWLPARTGSGSQATIATYHGMASLRANGGTAAYDIESVSRQFLGILPGIGGTRRTDVTGIAQGRQFTLYLGTFDAGAIVDDLTAGEGATVERTQQEYDVIGDNQEGVVAVGSDAVLITRAAGVADRMLDAAAGDSDRLLGEDVVGRATDHVEGATASWLSVPGSWAESDAGKPPSQSVSVEGVTADGDRTRIELAYGLDGSPGEWGASDLAAALESRGVAGVSTDLSSDLVTATGTFPTSDLDRRVLAYGEEFDVKYPVPAEE